MPRVLVTGANGYIGKHIFQRLKLANYPVFGIDNKGVFEKAIELVDIRDSVALEDMIRRNSIEIVINCAGLKSVSESFLCVDEYFAVNSGGVGNLVEISKRTNLKYIIQCSSAAVYGEQSRQILSENMQVNPASPYGESKAEAESILLNASEKGIIESTSFRYFNVVGSLMRTMQDTGKSNLFPIIREKFLKNEPFEVFGSSYPTKDGTCERDFIHVNDIAEANLVLVDAIGKVDFPALLNLGTGKSHSILEVYCEFEKQMGRSSELVYAPPRIGDIAKVSADIHLANRFLGDLSFKSFEEMVRSSL